MTKAIYDIQELPFDRWIETHADCDEIVIRGCIDEQVIKSFDCITSLVGKIIDVSDLTFEFEEENFNEPLDIHEYIEYVVEEVEVNRPRVILLLLANKDKSSRFKVVDEGVVSEDGKTLVFLKDPYVSFDMPHGIEHIGDYACQGEWASDKELPTTHLVIPEGVVTIGKHAFSDLYITDVTFPTTLRELGEASFESTELDSIIIPEGVEEIPYFCFMYAPLTSVRLPNSLRRIKESAFTLLGCNEEFVVPEGVVEIDHDSIEHVRNIHLPSTLQKIEEDYYYEDIVDDGSDKPYVTVHPDNPIYYSKNGELLHR